MIKYGLKIWSNNVDWFRELVERHKNGDFDFVEVYSNSEVPHDYEKLELLKATNVEAVHIGNLDRAGFHNFFFTDKQKEAWKMTVDLTNFFGTKRIIVHPAVTHTAKTFWENLEKLNDERIIVETMPVVSPMGGEDREFGSKIEDLLQIKRKREICFDIAKLVKAAIYFKIDYKVFVIEALKGLQPEYFQISGCDTDSPVDQHNNLWEPCFDVRWVKEVLEKYAENRDIFLSFETPKNGKDLGNDVKNIQYFKTV